MIKCIYLQIFDVENDVTVVCLCMFNVYVFLLQIISFQRPCLGGFAQVFRATHGLPPCDDESYDPYGPYGDLGDVETDEVLALDSFPPNKKCSFVPKPFSVHSSWKSLLWSYKAAQSGPNFLGKLEFVNIWLPGSLPGTWALSQIPTGTISFGRVKGAQKLSEGWMDVDWMGDADAASSPVQFSGFKLFHTTKKWLLKTSPLDLFTQGFRCIYDLLLYSRTGGLDWLKAWMRTDTACTMT